MKKIARLVLLMFGVYFAQTANLKAQSQNVDKCDTDSRTLELIKNNPDILLKQQELEDFTTNYLKSNNNNKSGQTYIVPVVFHILHEYGSENISDAQVYDAIRVINEDFAKANADTSLVIPDLQHLIGKSKIEFRLAQKDPFGNCTNGIDRIYTHKTNNADDMSKLNPWNRSNYLNIWVVKSMGNSGAAGYAYKPAAVDNLMSAGIDGIVVLHNYVGSIGTSNTFRSRTLSHEIGHYLNLDHPWGATNDPGVSCGDDGVHDTPVTKGSNTCNNLYKAECTNVDILQMYNFNDVTTASGTLDPTPVDSVEGIDFGSFSASGVSSNSTDNSKFSFSNWDLGATDQDTVYANLTGNINTAKYYEVTLTPKLGYVMTINDIKFNIQRSGTGVRTFAVRSDADNFTSNLPASVLNYTDTTFMDTSIVVKTGNIFYIQEDTTNITDTSVITLTGANFTNIKTPRTFRIYAWNAEDANGTFSLDSITINTTASIIENVQNHMDYSYCTHMFTIGQIDRMHAALNSSISSRNNLWKQANLVATGTDVPTSSTECIPVADFSSNRRLICQGDNIVFSDESWKSGIDSVYWQFPGATNTSSNLSTVNVQYNDLFWHPVSITAFNSAGSSSVTKAGYVFVSPPWTDYSATFQESFENNAANQLWFSITNENNASKWQITNGAAASGSYSMYLNAYSPTVYVPTYVPSIGKNDVDALISPSFNLSNLSAGVFTFKFSAANRSSDAENITEELTLSYSTNCGKNWTPLKIINGLDLVNAGAYTSAYFPTQNSNWETVTVNLTHPSIYGNNIRFKFEYKSGDYSNNLFLDDINITGVVGIDELTNNNSVNFYPNPVTDNAKLIYSISKNQNISISVVDLLGKEVLHVFNGNQSQGDYEFDINTERLENGMYILKIIGETFETNKKIIKK